MVPYNCHVSRSFIACTRPKAILSEAVRFRSDHCACQSYQLCLLEPESLVAKCASETRIKRRRRKKALLILTMYCWPAQTLVAQGALKLPWDWASEIHLLWGLRAHEWGGLTQPGVIKLPWSLQVRPPQAWCAASTTRLCTGTAGSFWWYTAISQAVGLPR